MNNRIFKWLADCHVSVNAMFVSNVWCVVMYVIVICCDRQPMHVCVKCLVCCYV